MAPCHLCSGTAVQDGLCDKCLDVVEGYLDSQYGCSNDSDYLPEDVESSDDEDLCVDLEDDSEPDLGFGPVDPSDVCVELDVASLATPPRLVRAQARSV